MKHIISLFLSISIILIPLIGRANNPQDIEKILSLHRSYRFKEAYELCQNLLKNPNLKNDTILYSKVWDLSLQCQNGINLLKYTINPEIVTKGDFKLDYFYLKIPDFQEKTWVSNPNEIVKNIHKYYNAIYIPKNTNTIYYSTLDKTGAWNIYYINKIGNNKWSIPVLASKNITTSKDEIFPILSKDGKKLFFASNGLSGMGGYDVYVSKWDAKFHEWGQPQNLGFPYSSTADDIMYLESDDKNFSILVSNREQSNILTNLQKINTNKSNITIYVTKIIKKAIKKELAQKDILSAELFISNDSKIHKVHNTKIELGQKVNSIKIKKENTERDSSENMMKEYSSLVSNMRNLQDKLNIILKDLDENRKVYENTENIDDKEFLKELITEKEGKSILLKSKLDKAKAKVQNLEIEFLSKGIVPIVKDNNQIEKELPKDNIIDKSDKKISYSFVKRQLGELYNIQIEKPIPKFDYTFKIGKIAEIAENNKLPDGLVYQIQIFVSTRKASIKYLKGLSPIFYKKLKSRKYLYTVGLFDTEKEAVSHLNQVKRTGFKNAFVVAFNNGKALSLKNAKIKILENSKLNKTSYQVEISSYPKILPSTIITAIRSSCNKNIAKYYTDSKTIYTIGPFTKKIDAENLLDILKDLGVKEINIKTNKK
ncbi:MAG: hypothetical protein WC140_03125 [Bacteroidales bacterium]